MNEQNPIKAEIRDNKLVIGSTEFNLEGLELLTQDDDPCNMAAELKELFTSISMIGALLAEAGPSGKVDGELLSLNFPKFSSLYTLKVVTEALKKM